jgi:hypothetical protein
MDQKQIDLWRLLTIPRRIRWPRAQPDISSLVMTPHDGIECSGLLHWP